GFLICTTSILALARPSEKPRVASAMKRRHKARCVISRCVTFPRGVSSFQPSHLVGRRRADKRPMRMLAIATPPLYTRQRSSALHGTTSSKLAGTHYEFEKSRDQLYRDESRNEWDEGGGTDGEMCVQPVARRDGWGATRTRWVSAPNHGRAITSMRRHDSARARRQGFAAPGANHAKHGAKRHGTASVVWTRCV